MSDALVSKATCLRLMFASILVEINFAIVFDSVIFMDGRIAIIFHRLHLVILID